MILMHVNSKTKATYSYFFCRGVQDHTCDAPYSNMDRIEQAVEKHYKTLALRPEFTSAVRTLMKAAIDDQIGTQRMLQEQTKSQLARLAAQEDNLIDLAADGGIDTSRVRAKLRDIARQRNELEAELNSVTDDIRPGMAYIEAHLDLLKDPHELYRFASDQTRRMLNQAIFKHIYVVNEEVVGDELSSPLCELLASQRGWEAFQTTGDAVHAHELAAAEADRHEGVQKAKQATVSDGLLDDFLTALLPDGAETVANCSRTSMVPLEGLEPPTLSLGRSCSSIELQRQASRV